MSKQPETSPSAGANPRLPEAYKALSKAIRVYGWEGGKEVPIALALDELLARPSVPLAKLAALAREAQ